MNLRTCAFSKEKKEKSSLFRVVRLPSNLVEIDLNQVKFGRGAYLSKNIEIIKEAKKKNSLAKILRTKVDESIYDSLIEILEGEKNGKERL